LTSKIGVDESGKGDYFGYLIVVAIYTDENTEKKLKEIGVKDSKKLSDVKIKKIAPQIKKICKYEIIKISPEKYNSLYRKFRNLNKLLAWAHARAIENMLKRRKANIVISDKFSNIATCSSNSISSSLESKVGI